MLEGKIDEDRPARPAAPEADRHRDAGDDLPRGSSIPWPLRRGGGRRRPFGFRYRGSIPVPPRARGSRPRLAASPGPRNAATDQLFGLQGAGRSRRRGTSSGTFSSPRRTVSRTPSPQRLSAKAVRIASRSAVGRPSTSRRRSPTFRPARDAEDFLSTWMTSGWPSFSTHRVANP